MTADLRHVDTWLFDLDNTLYPVECGLMGQMEARMTAFVAEVTGLSAEAALRLQKDYLAEHGLTLVGLMRHHGIDPDVFHAQFHDLSLDALAHDAELVEAIDGLPGRRIVFTNSDQIHAQRVLERLGLDRLFEAVFHIGSAAYRPKPSPEPFARLCAEHRIAPEGACFFEDSERNLKPAHELGMTTVLVGPDAIASDAPFVTYRTPHLAPFLRGARLTRH